MDLIFKKIIKKIINYKNTFQIVSDRKDWTEYFNNGEPPLEQNTSEIYNKFYADHEILKIYYNEARLKFYKDVMIFMKEKGIIVSNSSILDIGCGNGHLLNEIANETKGNKLSGCDFSIKGIEFAEQIFPQFIFFQHDILLHLDSKYKFVICTEVLEHIVDIDLAIVNILNIIDKGGSAFFTVPDGRKDTLEEHINFWSLESWTYFLINKTRDNFQIECGYFGNHLFAYLTSIK